MDIDRVNFGAKYINTIKIKKFDEVSESFANYSVAFVKLDPNNKDDLRVVDAAVIQWKDADYIKKIATASHWIGKAPIEVYALTTQKNNFNKLKPSKILGFAEMRKDQIRLDFNWLYYLQVNPKAININKTNSSNQYKYVGTSILKSLKKIYNNISLYSVNIPPIIKFYKDNGFIKDFIGENHYLWTSNLLKRLKIYYEQFMHASGI